MKRTISLALALALASGCATYSNLSAEERQQLRDDIRKDVMLAADLFVHVVTIALTVYEAVRDTRTDEENEASQDRFTQFAEDGLEFLRQLEEFEQTDEVQNLVERITALLGRINKATEGG